MKPLQGNGKERVFRNLCKLEKNVEEAQSCSPPTVS